MKLLIGATAICVVPVAIAAVPTVRLRNGVQMPLIAAGSWQYNDTQAEASISAALKVGFTMVDTALDYNNQAAVGRAIRNSGVPRDSVFVETKVPGCGFDNISTTSCYEDTARALETDLELLNMTYVDLVILHFPPHASFYLRSCHLWVCTQVRQQWRALEEFLEAGKARAIGVSNYCPSCFACLDANSTVFPMVNQVGYHIGMGPDPSGFKSFADKHGMILQAYSPLGNTPWSQGPDKDILKGSLTTSLAQAHGKSTIAVALKWLVQHGVAVVTKSSNPEHLAEDVDLWSWNLTEAEMASADSYHRFGMPSFACNFESATLV
jgi:diketogulonate reductase-like aldo/keto reductase